MLNIAIWGAAGNMGTRACARLRENPDYNILCVEVIESAIAKLRARGDVPVPPEEALKIAEVVILAVADKYLKEVAAAAIPMARSGALVITLDPAAAYAGVLPRRDDIAYFVTHPTHPPLYNDETDPEALRDYFGAGKAKQSIVSTLIQGQESDYALGEAISRQFFSPIIRSHRVTLEQMAMLEPAMSELCGATFIVALREAMEEAIRRGMPRQVAWDFMIGHINVQLAIVFEQIDWKMSEGAYRVIEEGMKHIFRPDWKKVFEPELVKAVARKIVGA